MERVTRDDVAVFVDFENVYVSVREKFDATPNFELIMDRCEDYGRIVIARAYADWYRYPRVTSALFANGVEPMYVPTYYYDRDMGRTGRPIKNSVDIHLCIDAMRTLYTEPNISKFVLVTGDRDFIPLVNAIRQRGKDVIIIGIGGAASAHLAQSADEFLFYEQIADLKATPQQAQPAAEEPRRVEERRERPERAERPERTRAERPPRTETAPPAAEPRTNGKTAETAEAPSADRTPFDTLVDAIKLARQRGFVVNLGSLKVVMRELDSDFHESKVKDANGKGFSKFKDFVKEAERLGKVQIFTNGTVTEIFLPGEDARRLSVFAEDLASQQAERELETELAQQEQDSDAPAEVAPTTPEALLPVEPVAHETPAPFAAPEAPPEQPTAAESNGESTRQTFGEREWDVFRTSMSQFSDPVRFAEIFNALRGLRNQEVVELTNNELKELVKQAINRGMLQRTGRGARAYYRLSSQYRVTTASGVDEAAVEQSASSQDAPETPMVEAEQPSTPAPPRRRARAYGEIAPVMTATDAPIEQTPAAIAPEVVEGEGAIPVPELPEAAPDEPADVQPETIGEDQPTSPSKSARRRSRRKAASQAAAVEPALEDSVDEEPATASKTTRRRSRRKPASPEAGTEQATDETPAPTADHTELRAESPAADQTQPEDQADTGEAAPRKRRRRKKPAAESAEGNEG